MILVGSQMVGHRGFEPRKTWILNPLAVPIRISPMPHNGYCSTANYLQGSLTQAILLLECLYRTYEVRTVVLGIIVYFLAYKKSQLMRDSSDKSSLNFLNDYLCVLRLYDELVKELLDFAIL